MGTFQQMPRHRAILTPQRHRANIRHREQRLLPSQPGNLSHRAFEIRNMFQHLRANHRSKPSRLHRRRECSVIQRHSARQRTSPNRRRIQLQTLCFNPHPAQRGDRQSPPTTKIQHRSFQMSHQLKHFRLNRLIRWAASINVFTVQDIMRRQQSPMMQRYESICSSNFVRPSPFHPNSISRVRNGSTIASAARYSHANPLAPAGISCRGNRYCCKNGMALLFIQTPGVLLASTVCSFQPTMRMSPLRSTSTRSINTPRAGRDTGKIVILD